MYPIVLLFKSRVYIQYNLLLKPGKLKNHPIAQSPIATHTCVGIEERVKLSREENQLLQLSAGESHCIALSRSGKVALEMWGTG